jgi:hypothetical protein
MTGLELKLNESLGKDYAKKWKDYYDKAFIAECFEIEEDFHYPELNKIHHRQITFEPVIGVNREIIAVACRSKNASLDTKEKIILSEQRFKALV